MATMDTLTTMGSSCRSSLTQWYIVSDTKLDVLGPASITASCFPSDYNPTTTSAYAATACPTGYIVADGWTRSDRTLCCPKIPWGTDGQYKMTWLSNPPTERKGMQCRSTFAGASPIIFPVTGLNDLNSVTSTTTTTLSSGISHYSFGAINAYGIYIAKPEPTSSSTSRSTSRSTTTTSSSLAPVTTSPDPITDTNQGAGGISTGAVAGIAVGAILAGMLVAGAAFGLFILRRRKKAAESQPTAELGGTPGTAASGTAAWNASEHYKDATPFLQQQSPQEMPGTQQFTSHELDGGSSQPVVSEMAAATPVEPKYRLA